MLSIEICINDVITLGRYVALVLVSCFVVLFKPWQLIHIMQYSLTLNRIEQKRMPLLSVYRMCNELGGLELEYWLDIKYQMLFIQNISEIHEEKNTHPKINERGTEKKKHQEEITAAHPEAPANEKFNTKIMNLYMVTKQTISYERK